MKNEKKLIKILERFRDKLSQKEIDLIDNMFESGNSAKNLWHNSESTYSLFTDGASQLDKNNAGIGGLLRSGEETIFSFAENVGDCTNNEAEYGALIYGLKLLLKSNILNINIYIKLLKYSFIRGIILLIFLGETKKTRQTLSSDKNFKLSFRFFSFSGKWALP